MPALKVVIADDHPIVLLGMSHMIQRDTRFTLVGEAVSSSQLIALLHQHQPEIVITDFNMPGDEVYGDGLKMIEYIIRHFPAMQILVLTMLSNSLIASRLEALGVDVIQKNHMQEEIGQALSSLSKRRSYQPPTSPAPEADNPPQADTLFASLSPRELEVVRLLVAGMSVTDIARQLSRSKKTVSTQKIAAMRKLGVDSDIALLTYCIETKLFN